MWSPQVGTLGKRVHGMNNLSRISYRAEKFLIIYRATEVHRWSDRRKKVEVPLFSGFVCVHVPPTNEERVRVLRTDGVVSFVGHSPQGAAHSGVRMDRKCLRIFPSWSPRQLSKRYFVVVWVFSGGGWCGLSRSVATVCGRSFPLSHQL